MENVIAVAGADARTAERLFFGWRVVAAAFVVAIFGWGICFYGPPVLLYAIHARRGWPLPLISGAVTLHFLLGVYIPRVHDDRILSDGVGPHAQRHADVRIVQIVRRADAQIIDAMFLRSTPQHLEMSIESLDLGKKSDVERVSIQKTDGVVRIGSRDQTVAGSANGFEMSRCHEARHACYRKVFHND